MCVAKVRQKTELVQDKLLYSAFTLNIMLYNISGVVFIFGLILIK